MAVFAESAMIPKDLSAFNMGRGAYDTTGVKKPVELFLYHYIYLIFLRFSLATSVFGIFDSVPNHVLVLSTITSIMD
ncbi:hypothetical protein BP00DRAFT_443983 [Aspergillus indologenus CBS 114.80]|uniref:Uncharacterized protein n=1 Tax=Aspergillus indologenus CBS 114.80 TaxID=1450541 RepID=A0A2V5J7X9_9EURO|nr:hypothetical protein BP00DRAFT_443983 [Aspergillus indologenus CBS 114.80]